MFNRQVRINLPSFPNDLEPHSQNYEQQKINNPFKRGDRVLIKNQHIKDKYSTPWKPEIYEVKQPYHHSTLIKDEYDKSFVRHNTHIKYYREQEKANQKHVKEMDRLEETDIDDDYYIDYDHGVLY